MIDAVFISDLHLHPDRPDISKRFSRFVHWAASNTKSLYILGDFFHMWVGDDVQEAWSESIAAALSWLVKQGVQLYFMHGNRDFLLGKKFAGRIPMKILPDPSVIDFYGERVLLTHGDRYCTEDRSHQWLRRFTRNRVFTTLFMLIPYPVRRRLVSRVRQHSRDNQRKPSWKMAIVPNVMIGHMDQCQVKKVIHGHIHQPGLTTHAGNYQQYVLSDWDDEPQVLCYYRSKGFCFIPIWGE